MTFTEKANKIFNQAIRDYHLKDHVDTPINNPYERESIEYSLYCRSIRTQASYRSFESGSYRPGRGN